ncbi:MULTISPECIES: hypothetical protein [Cupriavidus]|uniref:hypothetical protein n=1 Tax=Cupriavidus sp. DF5525 TaxID=3160989 RepID=UPI0032DF48C1
MSCVVCAPVFAPEQRHPVEVAAAEQGQLLPGESRPAAQLMYQNAAGAADAIHRTGGAHP